MRIFLLSANTEALSMRALPLGLSCVATAARRAGHEVEMLDLFPSRDPLSTLRERLGQASPSLIGISIRNVDDQSYLRPRFLLEPVVEIIRVCRAVSSAPIVLGGAGFSLFPDAILNLLEADFGIQGEGEAAFIELLTRLERRLDLRGVPGLYLRGKGLQGARAYAKDLEAFPLPDDGFLQSVDPTAKELWVPVQSRRGCAMRCSYCSTPALEGLAVRHRSAESVADWISQQAAKGFGRFFFVDNNFNVPIAQALELCERLKARHLGIGWRCILNPMNVNEALVRAMADSGCIEVSLGFESGCPHILQEMNKHFTKEQVRETAELLRHYKIRRFGFLLLGGPGETQESVEESLAFAASLELEMIRVTTGIRIYPDTPLAERARSEGIIDPDDPLLSPRFYLVPELRTWLLERVDRLRLEKPHWLL